jgi:hypothetical protein
MKDSKSAARRRVAATAGAAALVGAAMLEACSAGGSDPAFWDPGGDPPPGREGAGGAPSTTGSTTGGQLTTSSHATSSSHASSSSSSGGGPITWTFLYTTMFSPTGTSPCAVNGGCHTFSKSGFKCGTDKTTCYNGLVSSGWITPGASASSSPFVDPAQSPLCGSLGGNMPRTYGHCPTATDVTNIKTWLGTGAPNN